MTAVKRPRVAAIGLDDAQLEQIRPLCGNLRTARSLYAYLFDSSWTETDIVVTRDLEPDHLSETIPPSVSLMAFGAFELMWSDTYVHSASGVERQHYTWTDNENNERELSVVSGCPDIYVPLATELARQFVPTVKAPGAIETSRDGGVTLIESTSVKPMLRRRAS